MALPYDPDMLVMIDDCQTTLFERSFFQSADEYPTNLVYSNHLPYQHTEHLEQLTRLQSRLCCEPNKTAVEFLEIADDSRCTLARLQLYRGGDQLTL